MTIVKNETRGKTLHVRTPSLFLYLLRPTTIVRRIKGATKSHEAMSHAS
jgi:hypothetical protein